MSGLSYRRAVRRAAEGAPVHDVIQESDRWSRRGFLGAACAVIAVPAVARVRASAPRFGVRSPFPTDDLAARARLAHGLGCDGIELGPEFLNRSVDDIRAALDGTGIAVSAIVGSLHLLDPDPDIRAAAIELDRTRLHMAEALGASGVIEVPAFGPCRFPGIANTPPPHRQEDALLITALRALAPDIARTGVRLLIEPLTKRETHYMNLQSHGARVIDEAGTPGVALLSDFYHMQMEERDIGDTLAACGDHTAYVHLADGAARTEPGSLPFDYRPGFRALKRAGFTGWLTMECKATDNAEAALARALAYIKAQWSEA
jgi:sugar phosphate isomerase/epimerase